MGDEPDAQGRRAHMALAHAALRCGARRRDGMACQGPAMPNGRCRMHGGTSTGPRTPEGLARSRKARWKHGFYSAEAKEQRRRAKDEARILRALLHELSEHL